MGNEIDQVAAFDLDQRRAKAYSLSGYWPDAKSVAQALVKIEAGRALGIPPLMAMSEIHVIEGKPSLGAGAVAALVKGSGLYDYRVADLTNDRCAIRFFNVKTGELLGTSEFTIQDAKDAGLGNRGPWKQYPRNMLFARAMTNGAAWFCADAVLGRIYTAEELGAPVVMDEAPPDDIPDWPEDDNAEYADFEPVPGSELEVEAELAKHADPVQETLED